MLLAESRNGFPQHYKQFAPDKACSAITFSRLVSRISWDRKRWSGVLPGFLLPTAHPGHKLSLPPLPWSQHPPVPTLQITLSSETFPLAATSDSDLKKHNPGAGTQAATAQLDT